MQSSSFKINVKITLPVCKMIINNAVILNMVKVILKIIIMITPNIIVWGIINNSFNVKIVLILEENYLPINLHCI